LREHQYEQPQGREKDGGRCAKGGNTQGRGCIKAVLEGRGKGDV